MANFSQVGVIPFVVTEEGLSVLLLTSRDTGRWVIPKGWLSSKLTPKKCAAKEAFEEAGLQGEIIGKALGHYSYSKRLAGFKRINCEVRVFPLHVTCQHLVWRERDERQLMWVSPERAASMVQEKELGALILQLDRVLEVVVG